MRKLLFALIIFSQNCIAQPEAILKISSQISTENLKKNLYHLASDQMEGRLMASHGDTLASLFIADWFRKNKITAPYENGKSYFQAITSYKINATGTLTINGISYPKSGNYSSPDYFSSLKNGRILVPFHSNPDSLLSDLTAANGKGKVLYISAALNKNIGSEESMERFMKRLGDKGIVAAISSFPGTQEFLDNVKKREFLPKYVKSPDEIAPSRAVAVLRLSEEKMNLLLAPEKLTVKNIEETIVRKSRREFVELRRKISAEEKKSLQKTTAPNVIGMIKGSDDAADCIVISAHHDHDGRNGNEIYYGAVDNASGTVAIMEMASLMNKAVESGFRPKRTIVFASFTGEERGLLGSYFYADHPAVPLNKTRAIMNIDMMGRVDTIYSGKKADSSYAYILVKDSLNIGLRNALYDAAKFVDLKLDNRYEQPQYAQRRIRGSDQFPFYKKGVPFLRIDCGFAKEYHKPNDTPDKINYGLLTRQTQLAFLTLWNMANQ